MKKTRMLGTLLAAALCLPVLAAADGPEGASESQQKALPDAQAQVSQILGEGRLESGTGKVLAALYQELFVLKDARRKNAVELVKQKLELKSAILRCRRVWNSPQTSDEEIVKDANDYYMQYPPEYVEVIRRASIALPSLEADQGLIEEDIKDVESRIKDLTERLVGEEKGKK